MDPTDYEREYNFRARVPDHARFFEAYARRSAEARHSLEGRFDLAYGRHPAQRLDLFLADRPRPPLLVFIHGGYWQAMSKDSFSYIAPPFVAEGCAVAVIGYALCPGVTVADIVTQVREAVVWLHRNVLAARLVVAGHSAGGHLVAWLAATDWRVYGLPADALAGGMAVSALYDLEPLVPTSINAKLGLDRATARALSPLHAIPPADRPGVPPLVSACGGAESPDLLRQQDAFARAWQAAGHTIRVLDLPGLHHFNVIDTLAEPGSPLFQATRALLG